MMNDLFRQIKTDAFKEEFKSNIESTAFKTELEKSALSKDIIGAILNSRKLKSIAKSVNVPAFTKSVETHVLKDIRDIKRFQLSQDYTNRISKFKIPVNRKPVGQEREWLKQKIQETKKRYPKNGVSPLWERR